MDQKRSWLFVPGQKQRMVDKALDLGVDVVMLDLEDGVPPEEKDQARDIIAKALGTRKPAGSPARFVRINAIGHQRMEADLASVVDPGLDGLVLPKVESADEIRMVDSVLRTSESRIGLQLGSVAVLIAIESPVGLMHAFDIASASSRVTGLMFGAEDFGRELGLPTVREKEAAELLYARSAMAIAAAAAHVQAVDGVWPDIQDEEGLRIDAQQARRLGYNAKSLIHPGQIELINNIFSPSADEIDYAHKVIAAFEDAMARGDGSIAFGGQLIDLPIVERARRTLELAAELGA